MLVRWENVALARGTDVRPLTVAPEPEASVAQQEPRPPEGLPWEGELGNQALTGTRDTTLTGIT